MESIKQTIWEEALEILNESGKKGIRVDALGLAFYIEVTKGALKDLGDKIVSLSGIENPGSGKEVANWLDLHNFEGRGSNKERLQLVVGKHAEAAKLIGEWRTMRKSLSMSERVIGELDKHGRLHFEWTASDKSGRLYSGIQNLSVEIRNFLLPEEGDALVVVDYDSQELRILLHETGEKDLLDALDRGEDFHTKIASLLYKISENEVIDLQRNRAKAVTYGIPYGQQVRGLVYRHYGLTTCQAEKLMADYFVLRPKLKAWMEEQRHLWSLSGGTVTTKLGQIRYDCPLDSAITTKIQGSAADILCSALFRINRGVKGRDGRILATVHDSFILSLPHRIARSVILDEIVKTEYGIMPVKVKVGSTWGEAHRAEGYRYPKLEK